MRTAAAQAGERQLEIDLSEAERELHRAREASAAGPASGARREDDVRALGTPVRAAASGTVIAAYYGGGSDNRIIVDPGCVRASGSGRTTRAVGGLAR